MSEKILSAMGIILFSISVMLMVSLLLPYNADTAHLVCPPKGSKSVGWMKEARIQHQWWLTQELAGKVSLADMDVAGPPDYQRKWIYRYTTTIEVLKSVGCL